MRMALNDLLKYYNIPNNGDIYSILFNYWNDFPYRIKNDPLNFINELEDRLEASKALRHFLLSKNGNEKIWKLSLSMNGVSYNINDVDFFVNVIQRPLTEYATEYLLRASKIFAKSIESIIARFHPNELIELFEDLSQANIYITNEAPEPITINEIEMVIDVYSKRIVEERKNMGNIAKGRYTRNRLLGRMANTLLKELEYNEITLDKPYLFIADFLLGSGALDFKGKIWLVDFVAKLDSEREKQVKQWIDAFTKSSLK